MVFLKNTLTVVALILLAGCQNLTELYFYPDSAYRLTPDQLGLEYRALEFTAADGTALSAWWIPAQPQSAPLSARGSLLYLHGNAENISTHIHNVAWLARAGYNLLLLDYRGFGRSGDTAALPGVLLDIDAAAGQLEALGTPPYFLLGQSIGASLAAYWLPQVQTGPEFCALILDAPFARYRSIARHALSQSWLGWPLQPATLLVPGRWDPVDSISALQVPLLLFHSPDDRIIPETEARALYAAAPEPKYWQRTQGPHTATFGDRDYRSRLLQFMAEQRCRHE